MSQSLTSLQTFTFPLIYQILGLFASPCWTSYSHRCQPFWHERYVTCSAIIFLHKIEDSFRVDCFNGIVLWLVSVGNSMCGPLPSW